MSEDKPQDDPAQSQRFIDMAREVDAVEYKENVDALIKSISRLPPDSHPAGRKKIKI